MLLAAYKKYGSRARLCFIVENQACNKGALVDNMKKGSPTVVISVATSHIGALCDETRDLRAEAETPMGKTTIAANRSRTCNTTCFLEPNLIGML